MAESEGDSEALLAIDREICAYLTAEARKIDSYAALIRTLENADEACQAEARRLLDRSRRARNFATFLKELAMCAMNRFGVRVLESDRNRFRVQRNGGTQPVDVDAALLPNRYKVARVTVAADLWADVLAAFADDPRMGRTRTAELEADKALIADDLKKGVSISGAKLLERGEHLRLE